jgi:thioredoxin-like negative regulator of GroEL
MMSDTDPKVLVQQALQLDRQGRVQEALAAYQQVLQRWPTFSDCWYRLAALERRAQRFQAALGAYQRALDHGIRRPEEVHLNRAAIFLEDLHQEQMAERELGMALALNGGYLPAMINLATLYEDLGRRDDALRMYERVLAIDPGSAQALARHANASTLKHADDPVIERLRAAILASPSSADRAELGFALGRALDAVQAYPEAFAAYVDANLDSKLSAAEHFVPYSRAAEEHNIDRLLAAFGNPHSADVLLPAGPRPIFICGMFRSGSTLVEQLLAGHPRVQAGGELPYVPHLARSVVTPFPEAVAGLGQQQVEALAGGYIQGLQRLFPKAEFLTDKRPDNFLYIGLIKRLFPRARIVHTTRAPLDNCLSIYFLHLDQRMSYALDPMDIGHHYQQYRRLMAHWKTLFGADLLEIDYDVLVQDPKPQMQRLLAFLDLEWSDACLSVPPLGRGVKTASVWQVREPLYTRSSGRARHYSAQLSELEGYLAKVD